MDRRTLLAVFLSVGIYYAWLLLRGPVAPPPEEVAQPAPIEAEATPPVAATPAAPVRTDLPAREIPFAACDAEGRWSTEGGVLQGLTLRNHEEPYHVEPIWSWVVGLVTGRSETPWKPYGEAPGPARLLSPDALGLAVGTGDVARPVTRMEVVEEGPDHVVFRGTTPDGIVVEERVALAQTDEPCQLSAQITWTNPTGAPFGGPLWVGVHDHMPETASGMLARYSSVEQPVAMADGDVYHGSPEDIAEGTETLEGPVSWFGLADRYFGFLVVPGANTEGSVAFTERETPQGPMYGPQFVAAPSLPAGATHTATFDVYLGPLDVDVLERVDPALPEIVNYGWFAFFAHPLLWLLEIFHAGVKNWGIAIMLLTLAVKMVFFPLTQSAFKSSQAMQAIQPRLQELRDKHKDSPEELNRKTMELFRESGVNPLGGCLPMLVQMPIWIALYNVLLSSVELYHTQFLWLRDLSSADPTGILPAVVVVLMMVQQSFAPVGNLDPVQARVMKIMPLMFGIFFFAFPSGLVVYIFVNMVLSILQQWLIKRTFTLPTASAAT